MKTVKNNPKEKSFCIEFICNGFALKRDAFYKYRKRYATQKKIEKTVIELVHKSRQTLPREGTRKLMKSLKNDFQENNLKIGRDQLFNILRNNELLIRRKKYSSRLPIHITVSISMTTL